MRFLNRRRWVIVGGFLCGAFALVAAVLLSRSSDARRGIVFQAKVNGLDQLFMIQPDGTGLRQLTDVKMGESSVPGLDMPRWSPDGKRILLDSDYQKTPRQVVSLFTIRPSGDKLERLPIATGMFNGEGSWSPDGESIVYTYDAGDRPGHAQGINVAKADGSSPYALTRVSYAYELHGRAAWSPDGKWIAFAENYGPGKSAIMKVRAAGGNPVPLTDRELNGGNPRWSPDGTKILFNSHWDNPIKPANLYTISLDGKHLVQITHQHLRASAGSWSPDGDKIAYRLRGQLLNGSELDQLFIIGATGGRPDQLTHLRAGSTPDHPDWR